MASTFQLNQYPCFTGSGNVFTYSAEDGSLLGNSERGRKTQDAKRVDAPPNTTVIQIRAADGSNTTIFDSLTHPLCTGTNSVEDPELPTPSSYLVVVNLQPVFPGTSLNYTTAGPTGSGSLAIDSTDPVLLPLTGANVFLFPELNLALPSTIYCGRCYLAIVFITSLSPLAFTVQYPLGIPAVRTQTQFQNTCSLVRTSVDVPHPYDMITVPVLNVSTVCGRVIATTCDALQELTLFPSLTASECWIPPARLTTFGPIQRLAGDFICPCGSDAAFVASVLRPRFEFTTSGVANMQQNWSLQYKDCAVDTTTCEGSGITPLCDLEAYPGDGVSYVRTIKITRVWYGWTYISNLDAQHSFRCRKVPLGEQTIYLVVMALNSVIAKPECTPPEYTLTVGHIAPLDCVQCTESTDCDEFLRTAAPKMRKLEFKHKKQNPLSSLRFVKKPSKVSKPEMKRAPGPQATKPVKPVETKTSSRILPGSSSKAKPIYASVAAAAAAPAQTVSSLASKKVLVGTSSLPSARREGKHK